ncbi:MAG: putative sugar nucleotidyl transferase [Gemmatimonadaceae bacterium]
MIVLYDDARARRFEPFATTRPISELRAGALLGRERWQLVLDAKATGFVSAPHLHGFEEFTAPRAVDTVIPAECWLVNSRALPSLAPHDLTSAVRIIRVNGEIAAVRLTDALPVQALADGTVALATLAPTAGATLSLAGRWLEAPWDLVRDLPAQLTDDLPALAERWGVPRLLPADNPHHAAVMGSAPVWCAEDVVMEPYVVCDTSGGPIFLDRGVRVQAFTRLAGPCYVGPESVILGGRIAAASIGEQCRVHGELSMSVLVGHANKGHDGFVGHSVLGRWVNLGAGTITSNLKNTYGVVTMWQPGGMVSTGLQFAGSLLGDHVKTGIGLRLPTGTVVGAGACVMDQMPPKVVPPFAWGTGAPYGPFAREKFLDTAARMMTRRQVILSAEQRDGLAAMYDQARSDDRWPDAAMAPADR